MFGETTALVVLFKIRTEIKFMYTCMYVLTRRAFGLGNEAAHQGDKEL